MPTLCRDAYLLFVLSYALLSFSVALVVFKITNRDTTFPVDIVQKFSPLEKSLASQKLAKPYLVIHVGPTKTGTTSLQTDLTRLNNSFADDDWLYAGRYYQPIYETDNTTIKSVNRSQSFVLGSLLSVFFRFLPSSPDTCERVDCMNSFAAELRKHKGHNVLISDESIAFRGRRDPEAYRLLSGILKEHWNVLIVVSYRRFFQWLPSDLFQDYRMDMVGERKVRKNEWPGMKRHGKTGKKMKTLFPEHYKSWHRYRHTFTTSIVQSLNNSLPVKILNIHEIDDDRSLQTRFVCDVLPRAPTACQAMIDLERVYNVTMTNEGSLPNVLHLNYDILVVAAAEQGLVNTTRFNRKDLREKAQFYNEHQLKRGPYDFDLECPTALQLDEFLDLSLKYEREILGEEKARQAEESHRTAFQEHVDQNAFCYIDAKTTLKTESWKTFFALYAPV